MTRHRTSSPCWRLSSTSPGFEAGDARRRVRPHGLGEHPRRPLAFVELDECCAQSTQSLCFRAGTRRLHVPETAARRTALRRQAAQGGRHRHLRRRQHSRVAEVAADPRHGRAEGTVRSHGRADAVTAGHAARVGRRWLDPPRLLHVRQNSPTTSRTPTSSASSPSKRSSDSPTTRNSDRACVSITRGRHHEHRRIGRIVHRVIFLGALLVVRPNPHLSPTRVFAVAWTSHSDPHRGIRSCAGFSH